MTHLRNPYNTAEHFAERPYHPSIRRFEDSAYNITRAIVTVFSADRGLEDYRRWCYRELRRNYPSRICHDFMPLIYKKSGARTSFRTRGLPIHGGNIHAALLGAHEYIERPDHREFFICIVQDFLLGVLREIDVRERVLSTMKTDKTRRDQMTLTDMSTLTNPRWAALNPTVVFSDEATDANEFAF